MTGPCGACDRPAEDHPTYAAVVGVHDWTPPRQMHGPVDPIPHPAGGVTYPVDPSQVGQWWEDTDPDPVPGGGDRLPNRKATT